MKKMASRQIVKQKQENVEIEWSHEKYLQLFEFYEQREYLWKKQHPDYFNRAKRQEANNEIGDMLGFSGEEIRKKWTSMRQTYVKERNTKQAELNGGVRKKKKEWQYYHYLSFLSSEPMDGDNFDSRDSQLEHFSLKDSSTEKISIIGSASINPPKRSKLTADCTETKVKYDNNFMSDEFDQFGEMIAAEVRRIYNKNQYIASVLQDDMRELILQASRKVNQQLFSPDA